MAQVDLQGNAEFSTSGVVVLGVENGSINITGENSTDPDGDILYYDWDFGNGSVLRGTGSSFNNPLEISYTGSGLYDITLTVSDSYGGSSSTGITVELLKNQVPVPSWNLQ
ncbi:MAG: PKD domain-containing protein [Patescibacteria group bacterium]|nr:PKD domain-containing protein [Patescibacteria group bacterium]